MIPVKKLKRVEGKILTLIDSVLPEGQQNMSTKSLISQIFGELYAYADFGKPTSGSVTATEEKTGGRFKTATKAEEAKK